MLLEQDKRVTLHLIEIVIQELQKAYDDPPKKFQALDFRATILTLLKHLRELSLCSLGRPACRRPRLQRGGYCDERL